MSRHPICALGLLVLLPCGPATAGYPPDAAARVGMTRQRFLDHQARLFDQWDADHDGVLSAQEHAGLRASERAREPQEPKRPLLHPSK